MQRVILSIILLAFLVIPVQAAENRYDSKSGIIQYKISGMIIGEETLYFDNWGQQEGRYSNQTVTLMGSTQSVESIRLIDDDFAYVIDPQTNVAIQFNRKALMQQMINDQNQRIDYSGEMINTMGGVKIGTGMVLGKACNIWEIKKAGVKVWEWNKIALKSETKMMGATITVAAMTLELDATIDQAKLALPEGVEIVEDDTQLAEIQAEAEDVQPQTKPKSTAKNTMVDNAVKTAKDTAQNKVTNTTRQKVNGFLNRIIK